MTGKFVYTKPARDNTKFLYPSKFEQKANFVYTKLDEIPESPNN